MPCSLPFAITARVGIVGKAVACFPKAYRCSSKRGRAQATGRQEAD